ncbi:MAG: winged helix DNA-binding domain-containing protein [Anaerolineae bacterium]|nr:winged helix DNA-binding domain-containing protein [Anaerolineae bacterium]
MSSLPEFAPAHVNAWYMARQHLTSPYAPPQPPPDAPPEPERSWLTSLVCEVGWLHAPADPTTYLSVWARRSGYDRAELDRTVFEQRELVEVNAVRGLPMLVPREHVPLALRVAPPLATHALQRAQEQVGFTREEIDRLQRALMRLLERDPLDIRMLRNRLRAGLIRPYGEAGAKLGTGDSFNDALAQLVEKGQVFKVKATSRLDTAACIYIAKRDFAFELDLHGLREDEAWAALATLYFDWYSPARFEDFVWWSGAPVGKARAALARIRPPLRALALRGLPGEYLATEWAAYAIATFEPPPEPAVAFVPSRDPFFSFREVTGRFVPPELRLRAVPRWQGVPAAEPTLVAPILVRGMITGVWEWSPERKAVDWMLFDPVPRWLRARTRALAEQLTEFIRQEELTATPSQFDLPNVTYRIRDLAKLSPR